MNKNKNENENKNKNKLYSYQAYVIHFQQTTFTGLKSKPCNLHGAL